ncbi:MAG: tyrosine-type recombinase/integrase [Solirubrobacteraceae bacterium]
MLKGDAEAFDRDVRRRQQLGPLAVQQLTARGGPTLDQWIEQRWAPEHAASLERSTRDRYANVYKCHIWQPLGDTPLGELTVARLREWQAARVKAGVNPGTIHKARTFLSSVLRHAAESESIPGNPLSLVRSPRASHRDAAEPLPPAVVEAIRRALLNPQPREIAVSRPGQRQRRRYELPSPGTPQTRQRDALIVSLLAYAGLRPGELRALRLGDVREGTIHVQRAADPDGSIKTTKTTHKRTVRLLSPLAQDVREYRFASGRPPDTALLLSDDHGDPWDKTAWQMWRVDRWAPACRAAGLDPVPRPYDLRHSFASLLLAEGRQPLYVAKQFGHSLTVLLSTYAHLIDEFAERTEPVDAEAEIATARSISCASGVRPERPMKPSPPPRWPTKSPLLRGFREVPLPGFEPGFPP